jgi:hypothetical protein
MYEDTRNPSSNVKLAKFCHATFNYMKQHFATFAPFGCVESSSCINICKLYSYVDFSISYKWLENLHTVVISNTHALDSGFKDHYQTHVNIVWNSGYCQR